MGEDTKRCGRVEAGELKGVTVRENDRDWQGNGNFQDFFRPANLGGAKFGIEVRLHPKAGLATNFSGAPMMLDLQKVAFQNMEIWHLAYEQSNAAAELVQVELQRAEREQAEEPQEPAGEGTCPAAMEAAAAAPEEPAPPGRGEGARPLKELKVNGSGAAGTYMEELLSGQHRSDGHRKRLSDEAKTQRFWGLVKYAEGMKSDDAKNNWRTTRRSLLLL
jgi:hypothetical protein